MHARPVISLYTFEEESCLSFLTHSLLCARLLSSAANIGLVLFGILRSSVPHALSQDGTAAHFTALS